MGAFVSVYNFLGYRLVDAPFHLAPATAGLVFVLYLAGTVSAAVTGHLADRIGRAKTLVASVAAMAIGLAVTTPDLLGAVLIGVLLFTAGFFGAHTVASGWVGLIATDHRAEASSLYLFAYYLGSAVAGGGAGIAFGIGAWPGTIGYVGVLLTVALSIAISCARAKHNAGAVGVSWVEPRPTDG